MSFLHKNKHKKLNYWLWKIHTWNTYLQMHHLWQLWDGQCRGRQVQCG